MIHKSKPEDSPTYCHYYIDLVQSNDLVHELIEVKNKTIDLIASIPKELETYSYAPGKWSIKEVIRHIIDCERVYNYRAFRFSRFDSTELAGFDEKMYVDNSNDLNYMLSDLTEEYVYVRNASISLYTHLTKERLDFKGISNKAVFTARSLGYMTVGHNIHHANFIYTHYLKSSTIL